MASNNGHSHIHGWGADLDKINRPAVPMERTPPRLQGIHWKQPAQQPRSVKVFHSIERPGMTPVFGTSVPPSGLSGFIRKRAFAHSESNIRHWLMLLLADRVNVVEGLIDDARKTPTSIAVAGAALGIAVGLLLPSQRRW